jgi:hypothetical protein
MHVGCCKTNINEHINLNRKCIYIILIHTYIIIFTHRIYRCKKNVENTFGNTISTWPSPAQQVSTSEPAFAEAVGQPSVLTGDMQVTHFQESSGCTGFCREIVCLRGWLSHGF